MDLRTDFGAWCLTQTKTLAACKNQPWGEWAMSVSKNRLRREPVTYVGVRKPALEVGVQKPTALWVTEIGARKPTVGWASDVGVHEPTMLWGTYAGVWKPAPEVGAQKPTVGWVSDVGVHEPTMSLTWLLYLVWKAYSPLFVWHTAGCLQNIQCAELTHSLIHTTYVILINQQ